MTIQYDPQDVTDWATPLEKIYDRQSRQLDTYHDQLRERDRQEEAATLNIPEMFAKLASFSSSINKLNQARKAKKVETAETTRADIEYKRAESGIDDKRVNKAVENLKDSENLKTNLEEFKVEVQKMVTSGSIRQNEADYIISLHGGKFLKEQEFIGHQRTQQMLALFREELKKPEVQADWDLNVNNPQARTAQIRRFAIKNYESIGLKKEFVIDNYWGSIQKQLNTKDVLGNIKYNKVRLTQKSIEIDSEIDVASGQLESNPNALTFQAALHIKAGVDTDRGITVEQSKENYTNRLYRIGKEGGLKDHELEAIRSGKLEDHPAGTTGDILLKPEQWQKIQQGINEYNKSQIAQHDALELSNAVNIESKIISGEGSIKELQQLKEEGLLRLENTVGKNNPTYKSLEAIDPTFQSPESYAATREEYRGYYTGSDLGKLLQNKESFKSIPNKRVSRELLDKVKEAEEYLADAGLPITWDKLQTAAKDEILTSPAQQQNLKRDKVFSEETKRIQTELAQKRLQLHLYMKDKYPDPIEASMQAEKAYKEWKDSEGFNVKDVPGNEEMVGRLSPNIEGEYIRAGFLREARVENNTKPSTYQIDHWSAKTQKAIINSNGNIEDMLNKPESLIDKEDVLGAFIEPSQTDEFQLFYSPELITKSLAIGKQPGYVLKKTLETLIGNPTYKEYVKKFKLKEKLKILENAPDLRLKEIIDKLGDKDLITQYNYQGLMSFTPKQLTRLMNLEISMNVPIVEK
jgi:ribosomal protein S20